MGRPPGADLSSPSEFALTHYNKTGRGYRATCSPKSRRSVDTVRADQADTPYQAEDYFHTTLGMALVCQGHDMAKGNQYSPQAAGPTCP